MFIFTLVFWRAQCVLRPLGHQRKVVVSVVSVVMLFSSQNESPHNAAEMVGMRWGLIWMKRGFIFVFTL